MKKWIPFVALIVLFTSCLNSSKKDAEKKEVNSADFNEIVINNEYSMMIPKYMSKSTKLNDEASLQYQNLFKEAYIVVIDEPKEDFIKTFKNLDSYNDSISVIQNYRTIQLGMIHENAKIYSQSQPIPMKIDGCEAEQVEMVAEVEGVPSKVYYLLTYIEGVHKVYMVMAWTLENRKNKLRPDYSYAISSFKCLEK